MVGATDIANSPGPSRTCSTGSSRTRCSAPRPSSPPSVTRVPWRASWSTRSKPGKARPRSVQDIIDRAHALAANRAGAGRADRDHGNSRAHARYAPRRRRSTPPAVCRRCSRQLLRGAGTWSATEAFDGGRRGLGAAAEGRRRRTSFFRARRRVQCRPAVARHLQPRDAGEHRRRARSSKASVAQCAARRERRSLSRLPHAFRQLAHGRGPARHPPHRAARTLGAQVFRQWRGSRSRRAESARRLHERHAVSGRASRRVHRFLPFARRAAGAHRSGHRTTRTAHRRRRARRRAGHCASSRAVRSAAGFRRAGGRGASRFLSAGSASRARPAASQVAEEVLTDFDQDIASIFTDEAVELIDARRARSRSGTRTAAASMASPR